MSNSPQSWSAFVSYASADAEKAFEIAETIEARGMPCWIAPRDVRPGREYGDEIIRGINNSRCLILVLSDAANESPFVRREVERAVSKRKPIFPIRIEDVLPSPGLELFVSASHWIDAWAGDRLASIEQLTKVLMHSEDEPPEELTRRVDERLKRVHLVHRYRNVIRAAGGLAAIVVAVVIGTFAVRMIDREADQGGTAAVGDGLVSPAPVYAPQDSLALSGIDVEALSRDDFTVQPAATTLVNMPRFVIDGPDDFMSMLPMGEIYYGLNGAPANLRTFSPVIDLINPPAEIDSVAIEFRFPAGATVGPFTYDVDLGAVEREATQQQAVSLDAYATCTRLICSFEPLSGLVNTLAAVELSAGSQTKTVSVPEGGAEPLSAAEDPFGMSRAGIRPALFPTNGSVDVTLVFKDDTRSVTKPARRNNETTEVRPITLELKDAPADVDAPAAYVAVVPGTVKLRWALLVEPPAGYGRVLYTLDDGGYLVAEPEGNLSYIPYIFRLDLPSEPNDTLRLAFRDDTGEELGPFVYAVDWGNALARTYDAPFKDNLAAMIDCRHFAGRGGGSEFAAAMRATDMANSDWWFAAGAEQPSVGCLGVKHLGWLGVDEVAVGDDPDRLATVVPVSVGPDDLLTGRWDGRRASMGGANPFSIWHAVLPGLEGDVYARYRFSDGTRSDVVRIRTRS